MTPGQLKIKAWREDPILFVREQFKVEPDAWQIEALREYARGDRVKLRLALKACSGPGKSAVLAWIGWNFLTCYASKNHHPKGVAVSMTAENLRDNLWTELASWRNSSPFLQRAFEWTGTRIFAKDHPETWWISARAWSKTANAEEQGRTLSGLHSDYILVLIDESGSIPLPVLKSGEQALSNCKFGRIIQAGNPSSQDSMLYAASTTLRDQWHQISITGDPDDPKRSPRIDIEWARQQIATYGRHDPWVMAFILGQFPPSAINAILGIEEIEAAQKREMSSRDLVNSEKRIGVDVARFGDDRSFIARRQGLQLFEGYTLRGADGPTLAAKVAVVDHAWGRADQIFLDTTGGYGGSPEDSLRMAGYRPFAVNFSAKATDDKFFNLRSQILWSLADLIKRGGCLPKSPTLAKELAVLTYTFQNGKIRVVEKDKMKEDLGYSPDEVDAYATTFALPDKPRAMVKRAQPKPWIPRTMR